MSGGGSAGWFLVSAGAEEGRLGEQDVGQAVSARAVATWLVPGTVLPCNLPREDTRDAFISPKAGSPEELPDGSVIGTASLRRQAQLLAMNPTFTCVNFRGNVQTRLKKLGEGIVDATLLAKAGLNRMQLDEHITKVLRPSPAPAPSPSPSPSPSPAPSPSAGA